MKFLKFNIVIFSLSLLLVMFANANGDCPACFNLVKVEISFIDGRIKSGYVKEESYYSQKLSSMDKFTIIEEYYGIDSLMIDKNTLKNRDYLARFYYDISDAIDVEKSEVKEIKVFGDKIELYGSLDGLPKDHLNLILSQKPYYHLNIGDCVLFSYDPNYDEARFRIEKDKCNELCGEADDCQQAYGCIHNFFNLSSRFLMYCEEVD